MLIEFRTGNYLSFNDEVAMSMIAANTIKEHEENTKTSNVFTEPTGKNKLLKSNVIYGANASGKSNLISAISFFKDFVLTSSNNKNEGDKIKLLKFLLSSETENEPSFFQITILVDDIRYRYGFEADEKKIHSEWLFSLNNSPYAKESKLFIREFQDITVNKKAFPEGKNLEDKTRGNALFLSTVAQLNGKISNIIRHWINNDLIIVSGIDDEDYTEFTITKWIKDKKFRLILSEFFKAIKIGFEKIEITEEQQFIKKILPDLLPDNAPSEMKEIFSDLQNLKEKITKLKQLDIEEKDISINFLHKKTNQAGDFIDFVNIDFHLQSKGTQKLFNIFGLWIDAIENNRVLIIDELDARLHTLLTVELIKIFHSSNNQYAQLIFASHDTNLLRKDLFRRDQIWFTEKNNLGATDLYSLVEYKINQATVRNDASFEKDYLSGKYGAIPFLGDIEKFKNDFLNDIGDE